MLISDYFTRPTQNKIEVETLKKWGDSWAIHKFIIEKNFCEAAENIGFKSVLLKDITKNIFPSIKIMHRSYYPGIFISRISNFFGNRTNVQVINSKSGKFQYQSFKQGVWRYKHFLAFKEAAQPYSSIDYYLKTPKPCNVYTDKEKFKERFPIISKKGISTRNTLKRIMHFYLETGIKNDEKWF